MCGIVGLMGAPSAATRLLETLARLECACGCGGAGIATIEDGRVARREAGCSHDFTDTARLSGSAGIAYARKRAPVQCARSSASDRIAVAWTGVLRNARALKRRLIAAGRTTPHADESDVIADLINLYAERGQAPEAAVASALPHLDGALALACLIADGQAGLVIAAAKGRPLVVGLGADELYLSSTAGSLPGPAFRVNVLEDGDIAILTRSKLTILDADGMRMERLLSGSMPRAAAQDAAGAARAGV